MKKINFSIFLLMMVFSVFGQQTEAVHSVTNEDYLRKSKYQLIVAGGLLIGGIGLFLAGTSAYFNERDDLGGTKGKPAMLIGGISVAASLPLFFIANHNKRKAMSLSLNNQLVPQMNGPAIRDRAVPSLILSVRL